jgi:hypothetical protein
LREYIRHFSKRCIELPGATDNDAISAFQNDMICTSLIHRLGRRMPRMTLELLDIASNNADDEEVVAATLNNPQGKGKQVVDHGEGTSSRFKKNKKNDKRHRDDNLVAAVECKASRPKGNPTQPSPVCPMTTSRSSWMRRARTTKSQSSFRSRIADSLITTLTPPLSQERRIHPRR